VARPTSERKIISLTNPKSPISEAYVKLRTNIELSAVDAPIQVIMVTSPSPGEGKSTTASNLAVVYTQVEKKVLLIDADLRKPTIHHFLMVSNRKGLTSLLTGQTSRHEAIVQTTVPLLDVLPSGPIPPNPSELLASKKMSAFMEEFRKEYDIIILDTPPMNAVADAQIISTLCDGTVLVIQSGNVKKDHALRAKEGLERAKTRILGVVLNNVERKQAEGYYYYYYGE